MKHHNCPVDWLNQLESPANTLAVLTAMITPAVLISACDARIFSTASRMGRVIDRFLSARFEELARNPSSDDMAADRLALLHEQLERQTTRARMIQHSLMAFYTSVGVCVATSVAIAVLNSVARNYLGSPSCSDCSGPCSCCTAASC